MSDTIFRIIQTIIGAIFIMLAIFSHRLADRLPFLRRHTVDRILMLLGGIVLLLFGLLGRLPYLY